MNKSPNDLNELVNNQYSPNLLFTTLTTPQQTHTSHQPLSQKRQAPIDYWENGNQKCGEGLPPCRNIIHNCYPRFSTPCASYESCPRECRQGKNANGNQPCGGRIQTPCPKGYVCARIPGVDYQHTADLASECVVGTYPGIHGVP